MPNFSVIDSLGKISIYMNNKSLRSYSTYVFCVSDQGISSWSPGTALTTTSVVIPHDVLCELLFNHLVIVYLCIDRPCLYRPA